MGLSKKPSKKDRVSWNLYLIRHFNICITSEKFRGILKKLVVSNILKSNKQKDRTAPDCLPATRDRVCQRYSTTVISSSHTTDNS